MKFTHKYKGFLTNHLYYNFIAKDGFITFIVEIVEMACKTTYNYSIEIYDKHHRLNNNNGYTIKYIDNTHSFSKQISTMFHLNNNFIGYLKDSRELHWSITKSQNDDEKIIYFNSIKHWKQYVKLQVFK